MKPIVAPVNPGDQGAEVANLQSALVLLLNQQIVRVDAGSHTELLNVLARESRGELTS